MTGRFALATALFLALMACGCSRGGSGAAALQQRLPEPTKDEIALLNGRPLTIARYASLRSMMPRHTDEDVLWVGLAGLALEVEASTPLPATVAVTVARYAAGDLSREAAEHALRQHFGTRQIPSSAETRSEIEKILTRSVIRRNRALLLQLSGEIRG